MRLQLEQLESRYRASIESEEPGRVVILLVPRSVDHPLREARLVIDSDRLRLAALEYQDREGSVSRFEIDNYRPLTDNGVFEPPGEIEWLDQ